MLPPCHSYTLTRRRFLPSKDRSSFICNTDFTLQCKKFMVVRVVNNENNLLSSAILPDQRAPYSSLDSRIASFLSLVCTNLPDLSIYFTFIPKIKILQKSMIIGFNTIQLWQTLTLQLR
uniref:Uncharacterized protein n=1 Tax=Ixodes ricinus TaxID=34613 RepID=A0A147BD66_IXORI